VLLLFSNVFVMAGTTDVGRLGDYGCVAVSVLAVGAMFYRAAMRFKKMRLRRDELRLDLMRQARLCTRCGYDVRGSTGQCSECGWPIGD
jgi:hypothetical protein